MTDQIVGCTGNIITATRGTDGPGEVEVLKHGTHVAWSKDPLPRGTQVLIINTKGLRTVYVEPFGG